MSNDVLKKIEAVFLETIKRDSIDLDEELKNLGLDSLDLVEIMMELEEEFSIEFTNDEMMSFEKVGDVYEAIKQKI
ncbi:MAG: acyl carrier protein [Erysipelotrichaceae bacterium]|mgnify:CR=1 FL=1|nr:acyl carrier protein [Erysipelotrichaceae bacterium]